MYGAYVFCFVCMCVGIYVCIYIYMQMCVYVGMHVYVCMYVCMYVYLHCLCVLLSTGTVLLNAYFVCKKMYIYTGFCIFTITLTALLSCLLR